MFADDATVHLLHCITVVFSYFFFFMFLFFFFMVFFFQAEDGIRDLVRSRGLGDVYKRQALCRVTKPGTGTANIGSDSGTGLPTICLRHTGAGHSEIFGSSGVGS